MLPPGFYCERLQPGLAGEPLNALSNLGFLLAAAWLWWRVAPRLQGGGALTAGALPGPTAAARHPRSPAAVVAREVRGLAGLLALVGLASLSFHTVASRATQVLDVACIGVFNVVYLMYCCRRVLGWSRAASLAAAAGFVLVDQLRAAWLPATLLQGSTLYLPPLLVLLLLTAAVAQRAPAAARMMGQAAAVFTLSLLARTLDGPLCAWWPWGLHFIWHLLNAWVLLRLVEAWALAVATAGVGAGHDGSGGEDGQDRPGARAAP